jgi:hypothetical protein
MMPEETDSYRFTKLMLKDDPSRLLMTSTHDAEPIWIIARKSTDAE